MSETPVNPWLLLQERDERVRVLEEALRAIADEAASEWDWPSALANIRDAALHVLNRQPGEGEPTTESSIARAALAPREP